MAAQKVIAGRVKPVLSMLAAGLLAGVGSLAVAQSSDDVPRMADGKPDLSGIWWTGGDLGSPGFNTSTRRNQDDDAPPPVRFESLYQPWAAEHVATLSDKDDPTLRCIPTAFGTLNVRLFDVGTLGQIISTPDMMVFLTETFHSYQTIPTDGRPHRSYVPPSYRGDSVGHWEGDVFVVETTNFTDDTWLFAEGRASFHSDALRIVERYRRVDANTLVIDATIYDPEVLTEPWVVPTQTLVLSPDDQLLPLICSGIETQDLMDAAAELE
ncbi:MAG: hypothetical protein R3305_06470 [Gammaproteobacteria bacterium]|nr:hypothetical protein [Gammaproteobacteria bacterium]